jgi:hypothetical protein
MALFHIVCFSLLAVLPAPRPGKPAQPDAEYARPMANCNLLIELKSTVNSDRSNSFNLAINVRGGVSPFNYVLIDENGKLVSYDHSLKDYKNLKSGNYRCIVVDSQNCRQEKLFELK